jgi:hypothetical protein
MKVLGAAILVLTSTAAAVAKPSPVDPVRSASPMALTQASAEFNNGPAGATLERNYFQAPDSGSHSGLYLCRLEPSMFAKVRLTQSCK